MNVLSPGTTKTPGLVGLVPEEQEDEFLHAASAEIPLGRLGEPQELGKVAAFLASDDASFINGIELFVDGGQVQV